MGLLLKPRTRTQVHNRSKEIDMGTDIISTRDDATKNLLKSHHRNIAALLPPQMPPAKFMRTVANTLLKHPEYLDEKKYDRANLLMGILNGAAAGLEIDDRESALVPYGGKLQFQPMYQGLVKLARQSGEISTIQVTVARKGDDFDYELGMKPGVTRHKPSDNTKYGEYTHVYCVINFKDGGYQFDIMSYSDVMRIKAKSPSANSKSSPWKSDPEAMGLKTVLKRTLKLCPQSTELSRAMALDNLAEIGQAQAAAFDLDLVTLNVAEPEAKPEPEAAATNGTTEAAPKGKMI